MRSLAELNRLLAMMDVAVEAMERRRIDGAFACSAPPPGCVTVAFVISGRVGVALSGRPARWCAADTMAIVPAGLEAGFVGAGGEEAELAIGLAEARLSGSGLLDRVRVPIFADLARSPLVRDSVDELVRLRAGDAGALGAAALGDSLMKTCILSVLMDFFGRPGIDLKIISALADARLATVIAGVLERPEGAHSLGDMARLAGTGRSTFSRLFAEAMGQSPGEFVAKARLYRAAELLRASKAPIKAIAVDVGFSSRSHFSRAFRDAYGTDPTAYRQQHMGEAPAPTPQDLRHIRIATSRT